MSLVRKIHSNENATSTWINSNQYSHRLGMGKGGQKVKRKRNIPAGCLWNFTTSF